MFRVWRHTYESDCDLLVAKLQHIVDHPESNTFTFLSEIPPRRSIFSPYIAESYPVCWKARRFISEHENQISIESKTRTVDGGRLMRGQKENVAMVITHDDKFVLM